jgi:hypothetical protein
VLQAISEVPLLRMNVLLVQLEPTQHLQVHRASLAPAIILSIFMCTQGRHRINHVRLAQTDPAMQSISARVLLLLCVLGCAYLATTCHLQAIAVNPALSCQIMLDGVCHQQSRYFTRLLVPGHVMSATNAAAVTSVENARRRFRPLRSGQRSITAWKACIVGLQYLRRLAPTMSVVASRIWHLVHFPC